MENTKETYIATCHKCGLSFQNGRALRMHDRAHTREARRAWEVSAVAHADATISMEDTYTEGDKAAVKILRSLYLSETDGDVLYNARQYLQDRARYERNAAILAKTGRALAMNFDIPARDIIGMACAEMGVSESTWREMQGHRREVSA